MFNDWNDYLRNEINSFDLNPRLDSYEEMLRIALYKNAVSSNDGELIETVARNNWRPGITVPWQGSDNEERYRANLKDPESKQQLEKHGWVDADITYDINTWGFRSRGQVEFEDITGPTLITMGCSFTFGTSLPQEQIWPQLLADRLNVELANIAVPGLELTAAVQWLLLKGDIIKHPYAIAVQQPPTGRVTWPVINNNRENSLDSLIHYYDDTRYADIVKNQRLVSFSNYITNYHVIQMWAKSRNIPCVYFSGMGTTLTRDQRGYGRDLMHYGAGWHLFQADRMFTQIKRLTRT